MTTHHCNVELSPLLCTPSITPPIASSIINAVGILFSTPSPAQNKPAFDNTLKALCSSSDGVTMDEVANAAKTAILYLSTLSQLPNPLPPKQHLKEIITILPVNEDDEGSTVTNAKEFVTSVVNALSGADSGAMNNVGGSISTAARSSSGNMKNISVNSVVDMSWKFGVTASTDELKQVGSTFLQLKLYLDKNGVREEELVEMNVEQLYAFLGEMEKAKAFMDLLTS